MHLLHWFLAFAPAFADATGEVVKSAGKPPCGATFAGAMWPPEANQNASTLRAAVQNGTLELCGRHKDGYRWEVFSVHVDQLRSNDQASNGELTKVYESTETSMESSQVKDEFQALRRQNGRDKAEASRRWWKFPALRRILNP